ncbi:MAG: sulfite exporter TauE/SafE family protein [Deltaproteobacteria bacterium]
MADVLPALNELAPMIGTLAVAGVAVGILSGLFGIGGGSVLVPVLYAAMTAMDVPEAVRMQVTLGTSFAVIGPTGLRSFLAHRARNKVDMAALRRLAPPVFAGVIVGVVLASASSSETLRWIWVVLALVMSAKLAAGRDDLRLGEHLPQSHGLEVAAFVIGVLSALMSIGGGLFMVSLLMLFGFPVLSAVATSSGFGPIIAATGVVGYVLAGWHASGLPPGSLGYVNVPAALVLLPASILFAPVGVRLAHGLPKRALELAFSAFLALVALKFLFTLYG